VGNPEVSLLQLAAAYACLANGGKFAPLRFTLDAPEADETPVFSPQAAFIISDILSDPMARVRIFGGASAMNPPYRMAIKTGTSTHFRDLWAVAYTPEYTLAVWVGNFNGRPTADLSGAGAAAPIVADLAEALFAGSPQPGFKKPPGVASAEVCAFSGLKPGPGCAHRRWELFLAGTEPQAVCAYHHAEEPWHRMPANYAGWLHQRFEHGGEGRFRLAGFDPDLGKTFQGPAAAGFKGAAEPRRRGDPAVLGRPAPVTPGDHPAARDGLARGVSISYPLAGDRFLLTPGAGLIRVIAKAMCRDPLQAVTWFVDGREVAATGPPYELPLDLSRGRHRLTVVGPGGQGDAVEVAVQ
jgi:membrane carboxypeptidase/penicillin-binding protein PbpC